MLDCVIVPEIEGRNKGILDLKLQERHKKYVLIDFFLHLLPLIGFGEGSDEFAKLNGSAELVIVDHLELINVGESLLVAEDEGKLSRWRFLSHVVLYFS